MMYKYQGQQWSFDELEAMIHDSELDSTECPKCGDSQRVEPDAANYPCHSCGGGRVHSPLVVLGFM